MGKHFKSYLHKKLSAKELKPINILPFLIKLARFALIIALIGVFSTLNIIAKTDETTQSASTSTFTNDTSKYLENNSSKTISIDSLKSKPKSSGFDSTVYYYAKDTVLFKVANKTMRLRGQAKLDYKKQSLESEVIEISFKESMLKSQGEQDTSGKIVGYPKFNDKGDIFFGKVIHYNFKRQQGTISLGETEVGEGFYFGKKIKKISEKELFVKDGFYTTCDNPHPHYYFGSSEMKIIANDRVFLDPLIFYVEDVPLFILPFGLFFPNQGGRQSGIIIPNFFFSATRGVTFENMGVFLALSDYYDTKFTADLYSKGGFNLKNSTRWALRNSFSGGLNLSFGKTRFDPDDKYTSNWSFGLTHNQTIDPDSRITANMSFSSQDYNRKTSNSLRDRLTQNITSNASYTNNNVLTTGDMLSLAYNRDQNIISNEVRQTPSISYQLPNLTPLKGLFKRGDVPDWIRDLSFSNTSRLNYYAEDLVKTSMINVNSDSSYIDTSMVHNYYSSIDHSPRISISPKAGYFTISPSISLNARNFFRKLDRTYNTVDSSISDSYEHGFFTEWWYSLALSVSTRLYGVIQPNLFGIKAARHTLQPQISFAYTPPFGQFYGSYFNTQSNRKIVYSRFEKDVGSHAPNQKALSMSYSLLNSFEAKIFQGDTLPDLNVDMLRWDIRGSVNFAADSFKFSDISMSFRSPALKIVSLNINSNFSLYDEQKQCISGNCEKTSYRRIDKLMLENGSGLMRLTNISMQLSTEFSSEGIKFDPSYGQEAMAESEKNVGLGERFHQRMEYEESQTDFFGDHTPGFSPINIPWRLSLGLNFQYREPYKRQISRTISVNTSFSFNITPTLILTGNAQYDFVNQQLIAPSINITKDLHCWMLNFAWYPVGPSAGFRLHFGIKASMLQDLKLEKQSGPIY